MTFSERPTAPASAADSPHIVLLTGAGGKLGAPFASYLHSRGYTVRALVRRTSRLSDIFESSLEWRTAGEDPQALRALLDGVKSVVHLASSASTDLQQSRDAHVRMPQMLLDHAVGAGVDRFIALSSIKAIAGECHDTALNLTTVPAPTSDYGRFKLEAETLVSDHAANNHLATWTLRLPMVYGPGDAGSFGSLCRAARSGFPLPVAADNRRSFLFSGNLYACIEHLLQTPSTSGSRLLHLADGEAISTKAFYSLIADALGSSGRCVTLPGRWGERLSGLPLVGALSTRLLGSLEFETASLQSLSDWQMPFTTADGVAAVVSQAKR